jgi:hypothetical protein
VSVDLPKKHGRGGQSALRFARLRMEKRHNYVRKVAELAVQVIADWRHEGQRMPAGGCMPHGCVRWQIHELNEHCNDQQHGGSTLAGVSHAASRSGLLDAASC